ncbi:hypothetical protein IDJ77_07315 [Mucilaginibacter sp. ZT4R22]|uniref:DUF2007 domain-containing protein n=1 Tax=Mucilaginibacter pankratovii TaxID=2772110 RepID=A0ABR7WMS8_9SPHI|nr:hypothetical protein [Mucilaginibacter pankratovii]MBD1363614.1 hypothetical protein [Mucilaginibacter pankratovii]
MADELITYQKFNDAALADALVDILEKHDIAYEVEQATASANPLLALNNELNIEYIVKIAPEDFLPADVAVSNEEQTGIADVEPEHYLFAFTNEELLDLIAKRNEWSAFDYQLAQQILKERGVELSEEKISELVDGRIAELKQPEPPQTVWIVLGYACAVFGGLLGLFIGWHLANHKKTLPNGEQVFGYTEADRAHGRRIFYLAIAGLLVAIFMRINRSL